MIKSKTTDKRLLESLDYIDSKYIAEVMDEYEPHDPAVGSALGRSAKRKFYAKIAAAAACLVIVAGLMSAAPTILQKLGVYFPGSNTGEQIESTEQNIDELLGNIDIFPTSEPVALSEDEINNIVAAYLATEPEEDRQKAYTVKCYGKTDDMYAVNVFGWDEYLENVDKYFDACLKDLQNLYLRDPYEYFIFTKDELLEPQQAFDKGILNTELFIELCNTCLKYFNKDMDIADILQEMVESKNELPPAWNNAREYILDIPEEITLNMFYMHRFQYNGDHRPPNYSIRCYFEKDGIYTFDYPRRDKPVNYTFTDNIIGGYNFILAAGPDSPEFGLLIYKEGTLCPLSEAYERGIVNDEYIKALYNAYIESDWWAICPNKDLKENTNYMPWEELKTKIEESWK